MTSDTSHRTPSFPKVIDSTILAAFTACPLKAYREYFLNLSSPKISIHLHAGGAFAKAVEVIRRSRWEQDLSLKECMQAGFDAFEEKWGDYQTPEFGSGKNKTFTRMFQAVEFYFEQYPLDTDPIRPYIFPDGKSGVEFSFGVPIELRHPDTGDPIIFAGRTDLLGYYNKLCAIIDEKTTTQLGDNWINSWKMRGQFFGYVWAARQFDVPVTAAVIRGVAILKTKFSKLQVIETGYSDFMVERWHRNMLNRIRFMILLYEQQKKFDMPPEEVWPMNFGDACASYGGCSQRDLCTSPDPTIWYGDFGARNWNPLDNAKMAEATESKKGL